MICNNCKKDNLLNSDYCSTCGAKLFNDTNNKTPKKNKKTIIIIIVNFVFIILFAHSLFSLIFNVVIKMVPASQGTPNKDLLILFWNDITTSFFACSIFAVSLFVFNLYHIISYISKKKQEIHRKKC